MAGPVIIFSSSAASLLNNSVQCGTVCQRQFVTRTVYTLLNANLNRTFYLDSVMPFRSGFAQWRALNSLLLLYYYYNEPGEHLPPNVFSASPVPPRKNLTNTTFNS